MYVYGRNNPLVFLDLEGRFAPKFHHDLTIGPLGREGYRGDVARVVASYNLQVDERLNTEEYALPHSQTPDGWGRNLARVKQAENVENQLNEAATAVLRGANDTADPYLGIAHHTVEDEKHDFIEFSKHKGSMADRKTAEGCRQFYTDADPEQGQLDRANARSIEFARKCEVKIRELGKKQELSQRQIDEAICRYKQRVFETTKIGKLIRRGNKHVRGFASKP